MEKIIGISKHAGKVRKIFFFKFLKMLLFWFFTFSSDPASACCVAYSQFLGISLYYNSFYNFFVYLDLIFYRSSPIYVHTVVKPFTIVGTWKIMSKDCIWVRKSKKLLFKPTNLWKFCNVNTVAKIIQVPLLWQPMWKSNMNMWPITAIDVEKCSGESLLN